MFQVHWVHFLEKMYDRQIRIDRPAKARCVLLACLDIAAKFILAVLEAQITAGAGHQQRASGRHQGKVAGGQSLGNFGVDAVGRRTSATVSIFDLHQVDSRALEKIDQGFIVLLGRGRQ